MLVITQKEIEELLNGKKQVSFKFKGSGSFYNVKVVKTNKGWAYICENNGIVNQIYKKTKEEIKEALYKKMSSLGFKRKELNSKEILLPTGIFSFDDNEGNTEDLSKGELIDVKPKYIFPKGKILKNLTLREGEEIETTDYGYNVIYSDGEKKAYGQDGKTELFGNEWFREIETTDYGYNVIDGYGEKKAFGQDGKTELFGNRWFKEIETTDYGYNIIDEYGEKRAFGQDGKTELFDGKSFVEVLYKNKPVYKTEDNKLFDQKILLEIIKD